jgi:hypothetical protein
LELRPISDLGRPEPVEVLKTGDLLLICRQAADGSTNHLMS